MVELSSTFLPSRPRHSQMVTPAIPTHSWKICSQITNWTRRPMCKSEPFLLVPSSMLMYEVGIASLISTSATAMISAISASARALSTASFPRSRPRIYRASSKRPCLTSHRGDSGKNQTEPRRTNSGRIWKATGNRHRTGDNPPSTNERPLQAARTDARSVWARERERFASNYAQFEPVRNNYTENIQREFDRDELSSRGMLGRLRCPDRYDRIENSGSPAIDKTR